MTIEVKKLFYDIIEAGKDIKDFTGDLNYSEFDRSKIIKASVERKFEIIGEAINRINHFDPNIAQKISDFKQIIDFRNIIAHGYDIVDSELLWEAVKTHLPQLLDEVNDLMEE